MFGNKSFAYFNITRREREITIHPSISTCTKIHRISMQRVWVPFQFQPGTSYAGFASPYWCIPKQYYSLLYPPVITAFKLRGVKYRNKNTPSGLVWLKLSGLVFVRHRDWQFLYVSLVSLANSVISGSKSLRLGRNRCFLSIHDNLAIPFNVIKSLTSKSRQ
jgi:hypothetical protein